jgi:DNA-binding Lrp family transcriptional regulator
MTKHEGERPTRFATVPTIWLRHRSLSTTDKAVLAVLATYSDQLRYCYPSIKRLADNIGMSERTVQYALRRLEEIGAVMVENRTSPTGDYTSNGYRIVGYDLLPEVVQPIAPPGETGFTTRCNPLPTKSTSESSTSGEATPTPTAADALTFPHPDVQEAYEQYRRDGRNRRAFDATLRSVRDGMTTGKPVSMEVLGLAILEMCGNGELFNVSRLRGYIRKHEANATRPQQDGVSAEDPRVVEVRKQYPHMSLEMARAVVSLEEEYAAKEAAV